MAIKDEALKKKRLPSPDKGPKDVIAEAGAAREPEIPDEISDLCRRGEKKVLNQLAERGKIQPADEQNLIHQLRVHEIELEIQNEELRQTQQELESSREKYFDLYDLAPVGYLSLNEKGIILDANLTAAISLGHERSLLVGQPLVHFIFKEDQDSYYRCHERLLEMQMQQVCEVRMLRKDGTSFWVQIDISTAHGFYGPNGMLAVIADITARKQAEDESRKAAADLRISHEQLRHLAAHLQTVKEEERTRVALEIHDELGQTLTVLKMDLSRIATKLGKTGENEVIAELLNSAIERVSATIGTVKQICTDLRPTLLDHFGIEAATKWQADDFQKKSGVECTVAVADNVPTLDIDIANALFRVFQEALANVLKHSKATKVEASLKEKDGQGVGITEKQMPKRNSFGLLGMRERLYPLGGTISIKGDEQRGTTLTVIIPSSNTTTG